MFYLVAVLFSRPWADLVNFKGKLAQGLVNYCCPPRLTET
ncbi:hypothetical protein D082_33890 [Synechocystis sp. PCC 6714]|nr:hypothetical protein D082_33890 [Synechocystis sp. PCC 6714]